MAQEVKKFLDQKGVELLWSKLNLENYPNNDTLIAIINAIDENKADKSELNTLNILHDDLILSNIINTYILNINYENTLAFDTSEIVFNKNTSSILGQAILGYMALNNSSTTASVLGKSTIGQIVLV